MRALSSALTSSARGERRLGPHRDDVAEPRRVGLGRRGVQDQVALVLLQTGVERGVVALPRGDELTRASPVAPRRWRPACRSPSGCSRCGSRRTCGRSRTAACRTAGRSACRRCCSRRRRSSSRGPSRESSCAMRASSSLRGRHRAAFAHRDVVGRVEAERRQIAERGRSAAPA